jgi:diguanylate cyclase (GGDEF)-like protein
MTQKFNLIICSHFSQETKAALDLKSKDDGSVTFYSAQCGKQPISCKQLGVQIPEISKNEHVLIIGGFCMANLKEPELEYAHCRLHHAEQCFYMFADKEIIDSYLRQGAYLVTSGWLARWKEWIKKWKFDQNTAREFFRESSKKIVLIDTLINENSHQHLHAFSKYIDLPAEVFQTGIGFYKLYLKNLITEWQQEVINQGLRSDLSVANKKAADATMALDLVSSLSRFSKEKQVIGSVTDLFTNMFAPGEIEFIPFPQNNPRQELVFNDICKKFELSCERIKKEGYHWTESEMGFWLLIKTKQNFLGLLKVDRIAFPDLRKRYISLALTIIEVCGLVIHNTRITQNLKDEIAVRKIVENELERLAETDHLTGAKNRRAFLKLFEQELDRSRRYDRDFALLMMDIDHFKKINDTYGHDTGDSIIKLLVAKSLSILRGSDIFGRWGGEEFIILLPETSPHHASAAAERLRCGLAESELVTTDGALIKFTISIGLTIVEDKNVLIEDIINKADKALYMAKNQGRNRVIQL